MRFLMQIQVYVWETKALYEFAEIKGGEEQERLLHCWSKQHKGIMQCLCV